MEIKSFDELGQAVSSLHTKLNKIEELLRSTNQNVKQPKELLNIEEAAALLNLSKITLYGYAQRRIIPFSKQSKRLYFNRGELLAWVATGRKKTKTEIINEIRNGGSHE